MVKGNITDGDVSKNKVVVTLQHFGKTTKNIYRLDDLDGAKWFLDSIKNNKALREKIGSDSEPVETAIKTIAKAHQGKAGYGQQGWQYNRDNNLLGAYKAGQLERIKTNDKKLIYNAARFYKASDDIASAAKLVGIDLNKTMGQNLNKGLGTHKRRLEKASGI